MRISDWSSDVCCSDLQEDGSGNLCLAVRKSWLDEAGGDPIALLRALGGALPHLGERLAHADWSHTVDAIGHVPYGWRAAERSEEHTSELQSLMRISYAVFCLKKKK